MTRRNIILIGAVIVALLIAGYIVYRGFFAGSSDTNILTISPAEVAPVAPILSKGTTLDFAPVKKYNSQEQLFNYPKTSPNEVNLPLPDLIK
jgi:hypothetical protein